MTYLQFLNELKQNAEKPFASFQRKLIPTEQKILGVRTPILRALAKRYQANFEEIYAFPDEYYEVTFIKLTLVSALPYNEFLRYVESCVSLMDNWATCDSFKAKCIRKHRAEFLPMLEKLFSNGQEFYQRYVLVVLLSEYVEEKYLNILKNYIQRANTNVYYVHMAVAWLTAELLIKQYDYSVTLLREKVLDAKTHNKAIQKAIESYRLTKEQKDFLRSLKIKEKNKVEV
ncbi:MAG: DNA alkylation repair protein [Clostridia bacterium]|nr:DNA alkylation repair protein [Clostridia bacterium]